MKTKLFVEYQCKKTDVSCFENAVKELWKSMGKKIKDIKTLNVYYKPEECTCYYVVNDTETGEFAVSQD